MLTATVLLRGWLLLRYTTLIAGTRSAGKCIEPPTNRSTIQEMCASDNHTDSSTEWHLYPVDYEPYETSGARSDAFFRVGGINWRCIELVVRCNTRTQLQMTMRCQQVSAVYTVDLMKANYSYYHGERCCAIQIQLRPGVNVSQNGRCLFPHTGYELWGHASRLLFVQKCHNMIRKGSHTSGYWLFVSQDSDTAETRRALQALLQHYPFLRLHGWTTSLANKDACKCATFDHYYLRAMQCNLPMFDRLPGSNKKDSQKELGLRLVNIKSIHIVVPGIVIYAIEGVIVLNGLLFCAYILLVRSSDTIEV